MDSYNAWIALLLTTDRKLDFGEEHGLRGRGFQEYPFCAADAFQVSGGDKICDTKAIVKARKTVITEKQEGAHIMGVDPARFGDDRSSWIHRNRRVAWGKKSFSKISTSDLAARVMQEVERCEMAGDPIDCIMIDTVGITDRKLDFLLHWSSLRWVSTAILARPNGWPISCEPAA